MVISVLLDTDNGFIAKHTSPNIDKVVYVSSLANHSFEANIMTCLEATYNSTKNVFGTEINESNPVYSIDSGNTWTPIATAIPSEALGNTIVKDQFGHLYIKSGTNLQKSTDNGLNWNTIATPVGDLGARLAANLLTVSSHRTFMVDANYVWWANPRYSSWLPNPIVQDGIKLWRIGLDGTGLTGFDFTGAPYDVVDPGHETGFQIGSNRLFIFRSGNIAGQTIVSFDITNPAMPAGTTLTTPFGLNVPLHIQPVTNLVAIAHSFNGTYTQGGIWRTTDGGASWTQIVANIANLGTGSGGGGDMIASVTIGVHKNEAWCGSAPPYVYYTNDAGLTWVVESVDMSIFDPFLVNPGDVRPQEWTALTVTGAKKLVPVSTVVGAT